MMEKKERTAKAKVSYFTVLLLGVLSVACTDEKVSRMVDIADTSEGDVGEQAYSIKVVVHADGGGKLVEFGPMGVRPDHQPSASREQPDGLLENVDEPSIREQAKVEGPNLGFDDTNEEDLARGRAPGGTLASLAAKTCTTGSEKIAVVGFR